MVIFFGIHFTLFTDITNEPIFYRTGESNMKERKEKTRISKEKLKRFNI